MLYFIVFSLGGAFGVVLMCLLQINRMEPLEEGSPVFDSKQQKGGPDEQQQPKRA